MRFSRGRKASWLDASSSVVAEAGAWSLTARAATKSRPHADGAGHDGTHHLTKEPVDVAANIPALEHLFLRAGPTLGALPGLEYVTEQGIPFGYRTDRCAAGPVPERRRPAGRSRAGCSPGRGLARPKPGSRRWVAAVGRGKETSRSLSQVGGLPHLPEVRANEWRPYSSKGRRW